MTSLPAITDSTMERLAFIRHLYQLGVEQARKPEPGNAVTILILHDAVDSLLQLGAEFLGADTRGKQHVYLINYFDLLSPLVPTGTLVGRPAMLRLSKTRDNLKHHGVRPAARDVESLRASVASFFEANMPLVFGIAFEQISMAGLVSIHEARQYLAQSEELAASGDLKGAVQATATAFGYLMRQQRILEPTHYHRPPMPAYVSPFGAGNAELSAALSLVSDETYHVWRALNALEERLTFLTLGIDPAAMEVFKAIVPDVEVRRDGQIEVEPHGERPSPLTQEDVGFCYDFVVGVALVLQRRWTTA